MKKVCPKITKAVDSSLMGGILERIINIKCIIMEKILNHW